MTRDQTAGYVILLASLAGIVVYGWLLCSFSTIDLQVTAFVAVAGILGILAWIGWTMGTTLPPAPIDLEPLTKVENESETPSTPSEKQSV